VADALSGEILGSVHSGLILKEKHPPGSLMKVFTLIAYTSEHGINTPVYYCSPTLSTDPKGCWDRNGHLKTDAERALGYSCNVYFRQLAQHTSPEVFARTMHEFGLIQSEQEVLSLPEPAIRKLMVGSTIDWQVQPALMLRAYSALMNGGWMWPSFGEKGRRAAVAAQILTKIKRGLQISAREGTSLEASRISKVELLGKTGTTLLMVNGKADYNRTQGYWIGMYPVENPKIAVLTFVRQGRGATDAAPLGGKVLSYYLDAAGRQ
jgi:stage II sporulation protein D